MLKRVLNLRSVYCFLTPVVAGIYPVLYLAGVNEPLLKAGDVTRSFWVVGLGSLLIFIVVVLLAKNLVKGALLTAIFLTLFFSYGQLYAFLERYVKLLGHHSILVPAYVVLIALAIWLVAKNEIKIDLIRNILIVLVALSAYTVFTQLISFEQPNREVSAQQDLGSIKANVEPLPDVYFIVLDEYPRSDVWNEFYHYDNSSFLNNLKEMGFRVIECSQSNYTFTKLSISSTLNMEYHAQLPDDRNKSQERAVDRQIVAELQHSRVRSSLEALGYKTVALETGYSVTEMTDADEYIRMEPEFFLLSQFENLVYDSTALIAVRDLSIQLQTKNTDLRALLKTFNKAKFFYHLNRDNLNHLESINKITGPKFVFAHIYITHEPFTMSANGEFLLNKQVTEDPRVTQGKYLNKRMTEILQKILSSSKTPPIIVLESDHGVRQDEYLSTHVAVSNLMAFYVPESIKAQLYDTMTPVNSFRLVLPYLTGEHAPLLADQSFYIYHAGDVNAIPVDQMCPVKIPPKKNKLN